MCHCCVRGGWRVLSRVFSISEIRLKFVHFFSVSLCIKAHTAHWEYAKPLKKTHRERIVQTMLKKRTKPRVGDLSTAWQHSGPYDIHAFVTFTAYEFCVHSLCTYEDAGRVRDTHQHIHSMHALCCTLPNASKYFFRWWQKQNTNRCNVFMGFVPFKT